MILWWLVEPPAAQPRPRCRGYRRRSSWVAPPPTIWGENGGNWRISTYLYWYIHIYNYTYVYIYIILYMIMYIYIYMYNYLYIYIWLYVYYITLYNYYQKYGGFDTFFLLWKIWRVWQGTNKLLGMFWKMGQKHQDLLVEAGKSQTLRSVSLFKKTCINYVCKKMM